MIQAVIFDCFGVLATEAWLPFKTKYFVDDPALFEEAGDLMKQANSGIISYDEFIDAIAKLAGKSRAETWRAIRQNVPNQPLFDYITRQLKPKYKLGFLSNVADDYMRQIFTPEQLNLFDGITLSYKTGFIKPDAQAYAVAAEHLGVNPAECVFVDDSPDNVAGARAAGMQAVLYQNCAQMKAELEALLADSKS